MGLYPVDKGNEFIDEGMTLITETDVRNTLNSTKNSRKKKNSMIFQKTAIADLVEDLVVSMIL